MSSIDDVLHQLVSNIATGSIPSNEELDNSVIDTEDFRHPDLQFIKYLGQGKFGDVKLVKLDDKQVAVKYFRADRKVFDKEYAVCANISHPNIVKIYGACKYEPLCIVMEYAGGGSLHNFLHPKDEQFLPYTFGNAIQWCYHIALGVEYLHNLKPNPITHRDLKPPNLLMFDNGVTLKICDFGQARIIKSSSMTVNQGTVLWMAPEVIIGRRYNEKCDVYSWSIILWETLTRKIPYHEYDNEWAVMYAVAMKGRRPQKIKDCPAHIQDLMISAWNVEYVKRPSMSAIVKFLKKVKEHTKGCDQPVLGCKNDEEVIPSSETYVNEMNEVNNEGLRYDIIGEKSSMISELDFNPTSFPSSGIAQSLIGDDKRLEAIEPVPENQESMKIYDEHQEKMQKYREMKFELSVSLQEEFDLTQEDNKLKEKKKEINSFTNLKKSNKDLSEYLDTLRSEVLTLRSKIKDL